MILWLLLLSLAMAGEGDVLLEYGQVTVRDLDVEHRLWLVDPSVRGDMLARRDKVEPIVEGILYDRVAAGRIRDVNALYATDAYSNFLARVASRKQVPDHVQGRDGMLAWFEGRGEREAFLQEETKWLAQYWLNRELERLADEPSIEQIALEKFIVSGGSMDAWESEKAAWVQRVKGEVMRRKRLEIWAELVDRSKIKTYPENFEAFLRKHAPQPSAVEGPLSQKH